MDARVITEVILEEQSRVALERYLHIAGIVTVGVLIVIGAFLGLSQDAWSLLWMVGSYSTAYVLAANRFFWTERWEKTGNGNPTALEAQAILDGQGLLGIEVGWVAFANWRLRHQQALLADVAHNVTAVVVPIMGSLAMLAAAVWGSLDNMLVGLGASAFVALVNWRGFIRSLREQRAVMDPSSLMDPIVDELVRNR